jgi:hypothetical protein
VSFSGSPPVWAEGGGSQDASLSKPQPIMCQAGPDCDAKWAKANEWIEKSGLKILSKSDAQIKTKDAPNYDNPLLVVTITKNATTKPGIYEIPAGPLFLLKRISRI